MRVNLSEFLLARIAENEASAGRAQAVYDRDDPLPARFLGAYLDPARVLAECDAKRRIVELLDEEVIGWDELTVGYSPEDWLAKQIARTMALPHADHPDFDPEWRL